MCGETAAIGCKDAALRVWLSACMLERRGPQASGIVFLDESGRLVATKALGLVSEQFGPSDFAEIRSKIAIAHVRYATAGPNTLEAAPPHIVEAVRVACCSNGDFPQVIVDEVWEGMKKHMVYRSSHNDSEMLVKYFALLVQQGATYEEAMAELMKLEGAFSLVMIAGDHLIAARDPRGFRPLVLGAFRDGGYCVASEPSAFPPIDARFVREIKAGEMLTISLDGKIVSTFPIGEVEPIAMCSFEGIYFADCWVFGMSIQDFCFELGVQQAIEELERGDNIQVDYVMPIPNSSIPIAQGYADRIGKDCRFYVHKVRSNRLFLGGDQNEREIGTAMNFTFDVHSIEGKKFFLVDDSIVRGTTTGQIIGELRKAGAAEIHLRIAAPMIVQPCFFGINMKTGDQLIADKLGRDPARVREWIGGLDSLHYLSVDGLKAAIRRMRQTIGLDQDPDKFCFACFGEKYKTRH